MKRVAIALWKGSGMEGTGSLTTKSGAFDTQPYSFKTRFKNEDGTLGTNPEELIAAAHAGCFKMALSFQLGGQGYIPNLLTTEAIVTMENLEGHFKITKIDLNLTADIDGIAKEQFLEIAAGAKKNCPISQALAAVEIVLNADLVT